MRSSRSLRELDRSRFAKLVPLVALRPQVSGDTLAGRMRTHPPITQTRVNSMLRSGILFSVIWLAGLGSLFALYQGVRAIRAIRASDGALRGSGRAWWCIVVGTMGQLVWLLIFSSGEEPGYFTGLGDLAVVAMAGTSIGLALRGRAAG
jgi:hypothetical protein